jgi:hypothetical protein
MIRSIPFTSGLVLMAALTASSVARLSREEASQSKFRE